MASQYWWILSSYALITFGILYWLNGRSNKERRLSYFALHAYGRVERGVAKKSHGDIRVAVMEAKLFSLCFDLFAKVSFCLQELYGVQCRLLPVPRGRDFAAVAASVLVEHFASGGGPVMVGGGDLAHTIVGVQVATDFTVSLAAGTNQTRFLVLDPHYTGEPAHVETILGKGWVGWKEESFWRSEVPYNLCLLPPPVDADCV